MSTVPKERAAAWSVGVSIALPSYFAPAWQPHPGGFCHPVTNFAPNSLSTASSRSRNDMPRKVPNHCAIEDHAVFSRSIICNKAA